MCDRLGATAVANIRYNGACDGPVADLSKSTPTARGDIQGILDTLGDDIVWKPIIGASRYVPHSGERRGKATIAEFFKRVADGVEFSTFEPREFVAQGDKVVTLGHYSGKAKPTGRRFDLDFVMVFTLRNGKVTHFHEYLDVAALNAAFEPAAAPR